MSSRKRKKYEGLKEDQCGWAGDNKGRVVSVKVGGVI